jgi:hypothetical protein
MSDMLSGKTPVSGLAIKLYFNGTGMFFYSVINYRESFAINNAIVIILHQKLLFCFKVQKCIL